MTSNLAFTLAKGGKDKSSLKNFEKSVFLDSLIKLGEKLAIGFGYIRVAFNAVNEKLYFSEVIFTSANWIDKFKPVEEDLRLSKLMDLKKYK